MPNVAIILDEQAFRLIVADSVRQALSEQAGQPRYPERVSVKQAAEITGYSVNSLYQMNHNHQVPGAHKVGGKLMFYTAALREWVESGATPKSDRV